MEKNYKNFLSLSSLQSDEPRLGAKPLDLFLRLREEISIIGIFPRVARVAMVNE